MSTTIASILSLPGGPYNGSEFVGIAITSGVSSYFKIIGTDLDQITSVRWYPKNPDSLLFTTRQVILLDDETGTFMIQVLNNYLDNSDRAGKVSFHLNNNSILSYPVKTYGPVSLGPLWQAPGQGLITG